MYTEFKTLAIAKKRYCFKKGFLQISLADKKALKAELIQVLGNPSQSYFSSKLNNGVIEISVTLYDAITAVFRKYNIVDVWDITEA